MSQRPATSGPALIPESSRRAAVFVALCTLCSLTGFAADAPQAPAATGRFDGLWQTTLSCSNANGALGYSFRFPSRIKDGLLHGERGTPKEAGWLQIDGTVQGDGTADLYVEGLVGAAPFAVGQRPAGTAYGYHVAARFAADHGEGHRVEGRPCTVTWAREAGSASTLPSGHISIRPAIRLAITTGASPWPPGPRAA